MLNGQQNTRTTVYAGILLKTIAQRTRAQWLMGCKLPGGTVALVRQAGFHGAGRQGVEVVSQCSPPRHIARTFWKGFGGIGMI
eukprot:5848320-Alexandrium_andersonii.AAC.1